MAFVSSTGGVPRIAAVNDIGNSLVSSAKSAPYFTASRSSTARAARGVVVCRSGDDDSQSQPVETTLVPEQNALDVQSGVATEVNPDPRLASAVVFIGGFFTYLGDAWVAIGYPVLILGVFLYLQTLRVRFVFGPSKLNLAVRKRGSLSFIRGWAYNQIRVWNIFPSPSFPVLAYFREIESYNGRGSIHFFPIVADGKRLTELFEQKTGRPRG